LTAAGLLTLLWGAAGPGLAQDGGWLGVQTSGVVTSGFNAVTQESYSYSGAKVERIEPDSPAATTDLKVGDVIVSVAGKQVKGRGDLLDAIDQRSPGSTVRMHVRREKAELDLDVVLGKRPNSGWLGVRAASFAGAEVKGLAPDGPAAGAGFKVGDVI